MVEKKKKEVEEDRGEKKNSRKSNKTDERRKQKNWNKLDLKKIERILTQKWYKKIKRAKCIKETGRDKDKAFENSPKLSDYKYSGWKIQK